MSGGKRSNTGVVISPKIIFSAAYPPSDGYQPAHDPLTLWQNPLLSEKVITQAQIEKIDAEAKAEAAAAAEFGIASPWPSEESIFEDIYHEVDHQTQAGQTGRHFFSE